MKNNIILLLAFLLGSTFAQAQHNEFASTDMNPANFGNNFVKPIIYQGFAHYCPNIQNPVWYQSATAQGYFEYKAEKDENYVVTGIESYSDGLEWLFWINEYTLIEVKNIENQKVRTKIEQQYAKYAKQKTVLKLYQWKYGKAMLPQQGAITFPKIEFQTAYLLKTEKEEIKLDEHGNTLD